MANPNPKFKKIVDLPLVLTPKMVQELLGISKSSAQELWFNPNFPGFIAQNRKFVSRDALCRFMKIPEDIIVVANRADHQSLLDKHADRGVGNEFHSFSQAGEAL